MADCKVDAKQGHVKQNAAISTLLLEGRPFWIESQEEIEEWGSLASEVYTTSKKPMKACKKYPKMLFGEENFCFVAHCQPGR